jgi:hypothetical protein
MDRQTALLLALAVLFVAGIMVGASGWILFARGGRREGGRAHMKSDVTPEPAGAESHADEATSAAEASEPGPS